MEQFIILGIKVMNKEKLAVPLQDIFTKYGCCIKTRLGINQPESAGTKDAGLIILELKGDIEECERLESELLALNGVVVRKMVF